MQIKKQTLYIFGIALIILINGFSDEYDGGYFLSSKWQLVLGSVFFVVGIFDLLNKR